MSDTDRTDGPPSTIPPPRRPPPLDVPSAIAAMREELKEFKGDVKDLTRIARDCFDHLLIQEGRLDKLERRVEIVEARVTLLPPPPQANGNGADA